MIVRHKSNRSFKASSQKTTSRVRSPGGLYGSNRFGYGNYGASLNKVALEAWKAASADADIDIVYNLPLLRVRSRDLFMGAPVAGAAILTLRNNTIGNGLTAMPQIDGEVLGMNAKKTAALNLMIKSEFEIFGESVECDWNRRSTFGELTDLAFVNMAISGDVLGLLPMKERRGSIYDTKIRLIEADRVATPIQLTSWGGNGNGNGNTTNDGASKHFGGVELTDDGEVEAYWIAPRHPGNVGFIGIEPEEYTRIPAFGEETGRPLALLIGEMERPEQRRAVPFLGKCLTELKQIQRYIESTTIQNVIKSYFTAFVQSAMPSHEMFENLIEPDDIDEFVHRSPYTVKMGPGIINWMQPGDQITFPVNSGPDPQFEPYVVALCKFIGACLGIPYEVLLKQFSSSYSASRAALLEFWRRVKYLRKLMINQFCQPIYEAWMMEAIAKSVWNASGFFDNPRIFRAWTKCAWSGTSQGSIDPLKEIQASERKVKLGVSTLESECIEVNGSDWRANTTQQSAECAYATNRGLSYARNLDDAGRPIMDYGISGDLMEGADTTPEDESPTTGIIGYVRPKLLRLIP